MVSIFKKSVDYFGGSQERPERLQVLSKDGKPEYLFLALKGGAHNTASGCALRIENKPGLGHHQESFRSQ